MSDEVKVTLNADKTFTVESGNVRTNINYENTEQGKAMLEGKAPVTVTVKASEVMILGADVQHSNTKILNG